MIIIGLLTGLIVGGFVGYKVHNKIIMKKLKSEIIPKRGLYTGTLTHGSDSINVQAEFVVIDESADMYKLQISEYTTSSGAVNGDTYKKDVERLVNGWYERDDKRVRIFKRTLKEVRQEKLKELLENE